MIQQIDLLRKKLRKGVYARQYVLMDYHCPDEVLEKACSITHGFESPTIAPLRKEGWIFVRSMVSKKDNHKAMGELWSVGANGVLVTEIKACRL